MIEHVVVMAASPSRRMEALTRTRPKAMLPVLGKPIVARVMEDFYRAGIRRFTVVIGEKEGSVAMWLKERWYVDASLAFAPQGHRRGTLSALFAVRDLLDEPFIITSCDNLVPADHIRQLSHYFESHPGDAAVLSLYYAPEEIVESAGVLLDPRGHVMYISEQPTGVHQDFRTALPIYGFRPDVFAYLERVPVREESGGRMLAMAIQTMIDDGENVGAIEVSERLRIDTPDDLLAACIALMNRSGTPALLSELPRTVEVIPPVVVDVGVTVANHVTLGPNVYLETGSRVGANASLKNALVLGRNVGAGQHIDGEIIDEDRV